MTKTTALTFLTMMVALGKPAYRIAICTDGMVPVYAQSIVYAQGAAGDMFRQIGVKVDWPGGKRCPGGALRITFRENTSPTLKPGALAYALPFEGTHIVVFLDRIAASKDQVDPSKLLTHVLIHEITHMLQEDSRHSQTGIMVAHWTQAEFRQMEKETLAFTDLDVRLIHRRFEAKPASREIAAVR